MGLQEGSQNLGLVTVHVGLMENGGSQRISITVTQALIGEPLDFEPFEKWWAALRASTIWFVWIARNVESRQEKHIPLAATKGKIWHSLKLYMRMAWEK